MVFHKPLIGIAGLLLCAAAPPPPPAALEPYIVDGQFDHGDFGWMRGAFDDATEQQKADYRAVVRWSDECLAAAKAEVAQQLGEMGYADAPTNTWFLGPLVCQQAAFRPTVNEHSAFAEFDTERARVAPVIDAFLLAVRLAESRSVNFQSEFRDALQIRPLGEQMLRGALSWGQGPLADAPPLSPVGREILRARLGRAVITRDHANVEWLKALVEESGWPKISVVGAEAAGAAWLLVQHADADPLFQLEMLQRLEPLVAEQEVSPGRYALLYDRVMLKLKGKQRYATQMTCSNGAYVPLPLEEESGVERRRAEVGLGTLADYIAEMEASRGPCS